MGADVLCETVAFDDDERTTLYKQLMTARDSSSYRQASGANNTSSVFIYVCVLIP